ncbi:DMT family transporter [Zwartia sp.]|uniref:DMT family transporter n=1 Tax=Zwartia sp. TaxID=2978004 RepID=UPI0027159FBF|nr:DMT family transporter [Zwartia sp.]MDO9025331.1 DMT family transporter [Zwartia sp.]
MLTRLQSLFAIHLVAILFGATGIFGAIIQADALVITWGRALFAVMTLVAMRRMISSSAMRSSRLDSAWHQHLGAFVFSGAMLAVHWVTFFVSVKTGGIAVATLGFASFPAFITLIEALVLKERVGRAEWIRLLLVTFGLILITPSFEWADQGTEGLVWGVISGAAFGVLAVLNRRKLAGVDVFQVAGIQNAIVFILLSPWVLPTVTQISVTDWLWLIALGVVCTGFAHLLFVSSLRQLPARTAGLVVAAEPLYAILFAWLLFGQEPSVRMLVGAAIMMTAIFSASLAVRHQK